MDRLKFRGSPTHAAHVSQPLKAENSILIAIAALLIASNGLFAQETTTTEAFDQYVATAEGRIAQQRNSGRLWMESQSPARREEFERRIRRGEVVVERAGKGTQEIPGGLIHDWTGMAFIPNARVAQVVALVRDYNQTAKYYSPDVEQSRLLSANGDDMQVFMRLRKHKVVTVVLDTEYDVHYGRIDAAHWYSVSRSTRISEIENPGTPNERALPSGHDHGFMWRLNSYWLFEQVQDGVIVQCEAISLTRDIPAGLGWMVGPFVSSIPRESLEFTLRATRAAFDSRSAVSRK